ncbi:MAG: hypothetical protein H0W02_19360 [Ktedonobacteraceae bacterium]|nr:hypothetical protein [Ktedonobacteraceae bacterium]
MSDEIREDRQGRYLLVEGPDDSNVFHHLLNHYQLHKHPTIIDKKGIQNILATLDAELIRSGLERLGIVVDADTDLPARWQSLRNKLMRSGYTMPDDPESGGTIIEQAELPTVGIWLMPDNAMRGMLEDFVSSLIPAGDTLWPMAQDIVLEVIAKEQRFPSTQEMKAKMHTWLAWQEEPGKPMGLAITKQYLDANAPQAQQIIKWIRKLFDLEVE